MPKTFTTGITLELSRACKIHARHDCRVGVPAHLCTMLLNIGTGPINSFAARHLWHLFKVLQNPRFKAFLDRCSCLTYGIVLSCSTPPSDDPFCFLALPRCLPTLFLCCVSCEEATVLPLSISALYMSQGNAAATWYRRSHNCIAHTRTYARTHTHIYCPRKYQEQHSNKTPLQCVLAPFTGPVPLLHICFGAPAGHLQLLHIEGGQASGAPRSSSGAACCRHPGSRLPDRPAHCCHHQPLALLY